MIPDMRRAPGCGFWALWVIAGMAGWAMAAPAAFLAVAFLGFSAVGSWPAAGLFLPAAALAAALISLPQWLSLVPYLRPARWWLLAELSSIFLAAAGAGLTFMLLMNLTLGGRLAAVGLVLYPVPILLACLLMVGTQRLILPRHVVHADSWVAVNLVGLVLSAAVSLAVGGAASFVSMWSITQSSMSGQTALRVVAVVLGVSGALAGAVGNGVSGVLLLRLGHRPK